MTNSTRKRSRKHQNLSFSSQMTAEFSGKIIRGEWRVNGARAAICHRRFWWRESQKGLTVVQFFKDIAKKYFLLPPNSIYYHFITIFNLLPFGFFHYHNPGFITILAI